jgi:hypothetical protein
VKRYVVTLRGTVDTPRAASALLAALGPAASMLLDNGVTAVALTADEWDDEDDPAVTPLDPAVVEPGILLLPPGQNLDPAVVDSLNDAGVQVRTS